MSTYDLIDEHDTPLGLTASYDEVHARGLWHRGIHVVLFTDDGRVVVQKRAQTLPLFPGTYEISVGGGVDAGETCEHAAVREVREELGIPLAPSDLTFVGTYTSAASNGAYVSNSIDYCYKARIPAESAFAIDRTETDAALLVPMQAIGDALANDGVGDFGTLDDRLALWRLLLDSLT